MLIFGAWLPLSIGVCTIANYWLSLPVRGYTWLEAQNVSFCPHGNINVCRVSLRTDWDFFYQFLNHWISDWCTSLSKQCAQSKNLEIGRAKQTFFDICYVCVTDQAKVLLWYFKPATTLSVLTVFQTSVVWPAVSTH